MDKEDKLNKLIMIVPRRILFPNEIDREAFQGFKSLDEIDYENIMLKHGNYGFITRRFADGDKDRNISEDEQYKQPIPYLVLTVPEDQIFVYQRASNEDYTETKLRGKWSWGVGGHIESIDAENNRNPIRSNIVRELYEEVGPRIAHYTKLGYINDDVGVNKLHFGILHVIHVNSDIEPKDKEIASGSFRTIKELEYMCSNPIYNVESWSRIALQPLKELFKLPYAKRFTNPNNVLLF